MLRHRRRRRVESWAGRCTTKVGIKRRREEKKKRKGKEKRKIKENKRNGKSGSDDRWATARVEVPVYKLAVTTTHTLADLNTLFIPREGSPHPLPSSCLSARGKNRRGGREDHPRVHRTPGWCREAIHDAPIFIVFLASCFDPFPPPDVEGLNDFNHPLSPFFLLSSVLFEILSLSFLFPLFQRNNCVSSYKESWKIVIVAEQLAARPSPLQPFWKRSPLARFRRNSIDTHIASPKKKKRRRCVCVSSVNWLHCHLFMPRLRGDRACRGKCCRINRNIAPLGILIFSCRDDEFFCFSDWMGRLSDMKETGWLYFNNALKLFKVYLSQASVVTLRII